MIGTILNVAGILIGGGTGLARGKSLPPGSEAFFKVALGAFTVFYGLRLTWLSLDGTVLHQLKQLLTAVVALFVGRVIGKLLGLQRISNSLGRAARSNIASASPGKPQHLSIGFKTCAALFCAAPLGLLGSVQDGLSDYIFTLGIKAVMDGLAAMGFVVLFGWGTLLAAIPVLALQGSITLVCSTWVRPFLEAHGSPAFINSINAVGGLLVFSVALVIFNLKKIELADYLPSLVAAPLLTLWWGA